MTVGWEGKRGDSRLHGNDRLGEKRLLQECVLSLRLWVRIRDVETPAFAGVTRREKRCFLTLSKSLDWKLGYRWGDSQSSWE